ncbi:hypothetical protein [Cellulomonas sp. C5510]|uniref:hypothetical protein n=1 Tax=Cellulomonas sp. C5510 TaxID=2871170 RepID=UPI001C96103F|nr:hypothetical protein [Cellulomonas sp. C5510]QZN86869.1 hypothetical protein K5O09_07100 [Cellulomonas sp. C5510]
MTLIPQPAPPGQRMTPRARAYMAICASRHLFLGVMCLWRPQDFTSGSFDGVKDFLWLLHPDTALMVWGAVFVVVGALAGFAAFTGNEDAARHALFVSVVTTFMWAGGFAWSILTGTSAGWSGVIVWSALAAKDLTMLRDPLRNPFEDLVRHGSQG